MLIQLNDLEVLRSNDMIVYSNVLKRNINPNLYLSIVATNACQCSCPYCINSNTDRSLNMPIKKAIENIAKAKHLLNIKECVILGGEPTLYPDLKELISALKDMKFEKICLTTNGINLKNDMSFLEYGITHLNISIHNDNKLFGLEDLENVYVYIKKFNPDIKIRVNTNVYKDNHDTLLSLTQWIIDLQEKCDTIRVSNIIPKDSFSVNTINDKVGLDMIKTDEEYNRLFDDLIAWYGAGMPCIENKNALGFVDYTFIPLTSPVIVNRNIDSKVSNQVCENSDSVVNTIKCLVTGDLSLSWNINNIIKL